MKLITIAVTLSPMLRTGAGFDRSRLYRYSLWRVWDESLPRCCFCMLNPSTADAKRSDPTVTRCINFARVWGFGSLDVVNIFALRATNPHILYKNNDPIGKRNNLAIRRAACRADLFVTAWGNHGSHMGRSSDVMRLLVGLTEPHHLGLTLSGEPKHPLYLPGSTQPCRQERNDEVNAKRGAVKQPAAPSLR